MRKVQTFEDIQRVIAAGVGITTAIREAIHQVSGSASLGAFALRYGIPRAHLSKAINGTEQPTAKLVGVLMLVFGGTEAEWRTLLHEAGRPAAAAVAM